MFGNPVFMVGMKPKIIILKTKEVWEAVPSGDKMQISNGVRSRMVTEGMLMETMTIDRWLKKIEKL